MLIDRDAVRAYVNRDFDDFRWMKKLRRAALERELSSLRVPPRFKTVPWMHQLVCFYIGLMHPRFLFLLDMGLGKTKIIADLVTQLQRERKLEGALVTVPRLVNVDSWADDLAVHSDLEPWPVGSDEIDEKWERLIRPRGDVTIIDYQGLCLALCKKERVRRKNKVRNELVRDDKRVEALMRRYNFVDLDESHKLGNHESTWFGIIHQISRRAEFMYANTGTLFGKDVEALWSQFYLIDGGETFGENLGPFRKAFFVARPDPWQGTVYTFDKAMDRKLHRALQHRSIRYDYDEVPEIDLPRNVPRTLHFEMGEEQRDHYMRALEGLINANGKLAVLEANWLRMRQIVSGYLAWKDEHGDHVLRFKKNPKLDGLASWVEGLGGGKFIVCYDYTDTGRMIVDHLKEMKVGHEWFYGGTKDHSASRRRFLEDPSCQGFVMNSEAGGTGNDGLQKVARYMAFYETPTPPITRTQTERRIRRPGQRERTFIYDLVMRGSLDRGILDGIKDGVDCYNSVVNGRGFSRGKGFFLGE